MPHLFWKKERGGRDREGERERNQLSKWDIIGFIHYYLLLFQWFVKILEKVIITHLWMLEDETMRCCTIFSIVNYLRFVCWIRSKVDLWCLCVSAASGGVYVRVSHGTSMQNTLVQLENDVKRSRLGENMLQLLTRKTSLKHANHPNSSSRHLCAHTHSQTTIRLKTIFNLKKLW